MASFVMLTNLTSCFQSTITHISTLSNYFSTIPKVIAVGEDTTVEWKDNSYTISATEASSWEDGDWSTDWVEDPDGARDSLAL